MFVSIPQRTNACAEFCNTRQNLKQNTGVSTAWVVRRYNVSITASLNVEAYNDLLSASSTVTIVQQQ